MSFGTCSVRKMALLAVCATAFGVTVSSGARAASWVRDRTTPHLFDLVVIDRTGEPGWLFGREDVQGDGLDTFAPAERAIDLRSGYSATDEQRLWLRAYVSSTSAPDASLRVYVFIDSDDDRETGGSAAAPEIDAAFDVVDARGGYDAVIGMQGGTALGGVWSWDAEAGAYAPLDLGPLAALAESGVDTDPLRVFDATHGYLQVALDLARLGIAPRCNANLLWRSATTDDGASDLDVGELAPCGYVDADENHVSDALEVQAACERDEQCPADGLCVEQRCLYPGYCQADADCTSDERCGTDGICRATGGGSCSAEGSCAAGLVCADTNECRVCSGDTSCEDGERCAASGRCVDRSSRSGSGGVTEEGGVSLAPGQEVQGGAGTCGLSPPLAGRGWRVLAASLLLGLLWAVRRRRGAALLLVLFLISPELRADVDAERFKPAVTHDGWINAEGSAVRHPDDAWAFGAFVNYAYHPLVIADADESLVDPIVAGRLGLDLLGSVSLSERFALGLGLPVFLQHGDADLSRVGLGDLRLVPKLELVSDVEDGLGLALAAEVRAPTHSGDFAGGARAFSVFPKVILDHRFPGGLRIGANAGVILRKEENFLNVTSGNELAYAAAVGYRFGGLSGRTELGVELNGGVNLEEADDEETALEALGFLRHALGPEWELKGGAGAGVLEGYGVPTWRIFLGVSFTPTSHDRDHDGAPDSKDQCPEFAEDRDGVQDTDGCPEEDPDADRDGVSDEYDECPTTPETINGIQDTDGCPDAGDRRVVFDDGEFTVLDTIRFNSGSSEVHMSAYTLLDQVALTLRASPEIEHIRIEGHTDDTGPREVNMALSQKRALAVKSYLVERGVSPRRLTVRSYGPDRPREVGTGSKARAENRRVEFIVE
jgi:outer membrane protein OmpA-like peptidoglycan-associated protein